jgi:predicted alpha/beta superfamily hydrolase
MTSGAEGARPLEPDSMQRRRFATLALAPLLPGVAVAQGGATRRISVRARVPERTGTVYLTGNLPELGPWDPSKRAMDGLGAERRLGVDVPIGTTFEFKLSLGSWAREGLDASGQPTANFSVIADADREVTVEIPAFKADPRMFLADPAGGGVLGTLRHWHDVPSRHLRAARNVSVWLPPSYAESGQRRYPVLYMHDGQNLFDPRIASTGTDWGVDEAVVRSAAAGRMPEVIVVGVWSSADRLREYSPWHAGPAYGRFLIEELMPEVNAELRTLKGPRHTTVMGSSLGALISFDLARRHPQVFGAAGCVSTAFTLAEAHVTDGPRTSAQPLIVRDIARGLHFPRGPRLYFDHGTSSIYAGYEPVMAQVRQWLLRQGHREGRAFVARRIEGAEHNEAAWRARLDDVLAFLYRAR